MIRAATIFLLAILFNFQNNQFREARYKMVDEQIIARGITDQFTIEAMRNVPRHEFVPPELIAFAYTDQALSIGLGQTISQPYIVAYMTEALILQKDFKVLEIGTGSGYQAAILSEIVSEVVTIEIVEQLALEAKQRLDRLHYTNVTVITGDGYKGFNDKAPYDAIIVTAAIENIPSALINQLKEGGRLIIPLGPNNYTQHLVLVEKHEDKIKETKLLPVRFVPFTGTGSKQTIL
jgi:protein-L-isoaspartate(D-aspartate) O-methyltransferase